MESRLLPVLFLAAALAGAQESRPDPAPELLTPAESSGYARTATAAEVWAFLRELDRRSPCLRLQVLGLSPQGREIPLAVVGRPLPEGPLPRADRQRPVLYLQGNIHAGEVEGKEALLILLRQLLLEEELPCCLDRLVLLVAPLFNADGNERLSPRNRPHQNGPPGGVGERANGQGLDLNRDAIKAESREMRALLEQVVRPWDPDLLVDCHATNGSRNLHPLQAEGPLLQGMDGELRAFNRDVLLPALFARAEAEAGFVFIPYGMFADRSDPARGWETFPPLPRYLTNWFGARGRLAVLAEAYVYADFPTRIAATLALLRAVLREAAGRPRELLAAVAAADGRTAALSAAGGRFGVEVAVRPRPRPVRLTAVAERREPDPATGRARWVPAGAPAPLEVPFLSDFIATREVAVPRGWLLPPGAAAAAALLRRQGLAVEALGAPAPLEVEVFAVERIERMPQPYQGHRLARVAGRYSRATVVPPPGALLVSAATPLAWLACWLLEPESPDGLTAWGLLDELLREGAPHPVLRVMGPLPAPVR